MIKAGLAVLAVLCICMAVQRVSGILEMQFLLRQLEEIGDGSQIELSTRSRRKQMLALCNRLNEIYRQAEQLQIDLTASSYNIILFSMNRKEKREAWTDTYSQKETEVWDIQKVDLTRR